MADPFDVVVAGGGSAGLLCAMAIHVQSSGRVRVAVVDAGDAPRAFGEQIDSLRVSALSPRTQSYLAAAGAWPVSVHQFAKAYTQMRVWDESTGLNDAIGFSAADNQVDELGFIVENERVRRALADAAEAAGIPVFWQCPANGLRTGDDWATLDTDRGALRAQLIIAADGARSRIRDWAGIDFLRRDFNQSALVAHVNSERSHQSTAWQRFTAEGPIALLPLSDGRSSVVYSVSKPFFASLMDMDTEQLSRALSDASGAVLGKLEVASARAGFPLAALQVEKPWQRRLTLIGDAAQQIHPMAGQGANLGFADAAQLAHLLTAAPAGVDFGDEILLRKHHRARRIEVLQMQAALDALHRLFLHPSSAIQQLRVQGLKALDGRVSAKREIARRAMGLG